MTREQAYDILTKTIEERGIADWIYNKNVGSVSTLELVYIWAANATLNKVLELENSRPELIIRRNEDEDPAWE